RLRLLLDPGRDPVHRRLPADLLLVVDAGDPHHPDHLRPSAPLAGAPRLPPPRRASPAGPPRLLRLPVRLSGADLVRRPARLRAVPHRRCAPLEVTASRSRLPSGRWLISTSSR